MGSDTTIVANLNKRQYIHPGIFNDNTRFCDYLIGNHARAVAILVCEGGPGAGSASRLWEQYAGSWSRDRIVAAVDTGEPPKPHNTFGAQTTTLKNPERNLFGMVWEEFEDISYPMLILLCESDREFADDLLARTSINNLNFLWHLGNALALLPESMGTRFLMPAVIKRFGSDWEQLYQEQAVRERELAAEDDNEE